MSKKDVQHNKKDTLWESATDTSSEFPDFNFDETGSLETSSLSSDSDSNVLRDEGYALAYINPITPDRDMQLRDEGGINSARAASRLRGAKVNLSSEDLKNIAGLWGVSFKKSDALMSEKKLSRAKRPLKEDKNVKDEHQTRFKTRKLS